MQSQELGSQHGAAARKRANRIVLIAKERAGGENYRWHDKSPEDRLKKPISKA